jgi:hypothetical protein
MDVERASYEGFPTASMNDVGEFHSILNEEYGQVVSNDIPISFLCIELDSEPSNISNCIRTSARAKNGGESEEDRCCARGIGKYASIRNIRCALVELEGTKSTRTTGMHDSFWDTLVVEFHNLVAHFG